MNTKIAIIQTGYPAYKYDVFESLFDNKKIYYIDFKFLLGKIHGELFNKFVEGKNIIIGSFKNNFVSKSIDNKIYKQNEIAYISQFRLVKEKLPEIKIIKFLDNYCSKKKFTLNIYLAGSPYIYGRAKYLYNPEMSFYTRLLKKTKVNFKYRKKDLDNYINLKRENLIINIDSTLGYEMLALNKKVLFFSIRDFQKNYFGYCKKNSHNFGWPENFQKNGPFWTNELNTQKFRRLIETNIKLNIKEWKQKNSNTIKKIITHDFKNQLLLNEVKKIL